MKAKVLALRNYLNSYPYFFDAIAVVIFLLATMVINLQMIRYGLNGIGDVRWHITWIQHFSAQFQEGILYPRWLAGTNFGYGSPTFIFYPPFVYYVGSILKLVGFNTQQVMTLVFSLPIFLSGVNFYLYGRNKWGRLAGLVGAIFYQLSPYLIISIVRNGALSMAWAIAWIPLGLYLTDKSLINRRYTIGLAFFSTIVALTHTPSLLIFAIAWLIYLLLQLRKQPWQNVLITFIAVVLGLGMASIYLLPAIFEQKYININYQLGSKGGFITFNLAELLTDKNSWFAILRKNMLAIIVLSLIYAWFNRKETKKLTTILGWVIFILIVVFMFTNLSEFIWLSSNTLQKIQRSTRISGLFFFGGAAIISLIVKLIIDLQWKIKPFLVVIILSIFAVNFQYDYTLSKQYPGLNQPTKGKVFIKEWMEIALFEPYSDKLVDVPEYRPLLPNESFNVEVREGYVANSEGIWVPQIRGGKAFFPVPQLNEPKMSVLEGNANIEIKKWASHTREFNINVNEPSTLRIRTYYYPAWHLEMNNQSHDINILDDGTIGFNLTPGNYQGKLTYQLTPAFKLGLLCSILSLIATILLYFKKI